MGAWGLYLFQSDQELDIIDDLSSEIGVDLHLHETEADKEAARTTLDAGKFVQVFDGLKRQSPRPMWELVMLTACAMEVGAKVDKARRQYIRRIYKNSGTLPGGVKQMDKALKEYQEGTPWDFEESIGLLETAAGVFGENNDEREEREGGKDAAAKGEEHKRSISPDEGEAEGVKVKARKVDENNEKGAERGLGDSAQLKKDNNIKSETIKKEINPQYLV
jgi:hypothetical protein